MFVAWPDKTFGQLGGIDRATYIAVLTHDPKLDDAALTAALAAEPAYIGAMGSHGAQEHRRERLLAAGVTEEELAAIAAPIGLDLGGLTAEETALSIMAEIVAVRNGREGGRLCAEGAGRIHEVGTCRDRGPRARGRRGHAVRRAQTAPPIDGRPLLEHAVDAAVATSALGTCSSRSATMPTRSAPASPSGTRRAAARRGLGGGPSRLAALRGRRFGRRRGGGRPARRPAATSPAAIERVLAAGGRHGRPTVAGLSPAVLPSARCFPQWPPCAGTRAPAAPLRRRLVPCDDLGPGADVDARRRSWNRTRAVIVG